MYNIIQGVLQRKFKLFLLVFKSLQMIIDLFTNLVFTNFDFFFSPNLLMVLISSKRIFVWHTKNTKIIIYFYRKSPKKLQNSWKICWIFSTPYNMVMEPACTCIIVAKCHKSQGPPNIFIRRNFLHSFWPKNAVFGVQIKK